jgi:thiol-disulfide isomerase/thioredoxin
MNRIGFVLSIYLIAGWNTDTASAACVAAVVSPTSYSSVGIKADACEHCLAPTATADTAYSNQDPAAKPNQEEKKPDDLNTAPEQAPGGDNAQDKAAVPAKSDPASIEFGQLMEKYQAANAIHVEKINKAKPADQMQLWVDENPLNTMAPEFLALVNKYPESPVAFNAITVLVSRGTREVKENAVRELINRFIDDQRIIKIIDAISQGLPSKYTEGWFEEIASKSHDKEIQGKAIQAHLDYIVSVRQTRDFVKKDPQAYAQVGKEITNFLENYDYDKAEQKRIELLTKLSKEFQDVPSEIRDKSYGAIADRELFIVNNLSVGKTPPDIEGEDLEGKSFKLSDYRGKVVMVEFWGDWCAPCKRMYPQMRSIAKKLDGKPFALIGVNSDNDLDATRKTVEEKQLAWRSFWNGTGGTQGPISNAWQVNAWPTIYLLDASGVIRYKNVRDKELDEAITKMLAEMGHDVDLTDHSDGILESEKPKKQVLVPYQKPLEIELKQGPPKDDAKDSKKGGGK